MTIESYCTLQTIPLRKEDIFIFVCLHSELKKEKFVTHLSQYEQFKVEEGKL